MSSLRLATLIALLFSTNAPTFGETSSWVFRPSTYTHDPATGARVAQYQRVAPVEDLPDPRLVTSGYRRTRTTIRGIDGTVDSSYQVQSFANGRGGLDAEWERFHDAWRQSFLTGSFFNQNGFAPFGFPGGGFPGGPFPGNTFPGATVPAGAFPYGIPPGGGFSPGVYPGYGYPPYGYPGYGVPPAGFPNGRGLGRRGAPAPAAP